MLSHFPVLQSSSNYLIPDFVNRMPDQGVAWVTVCCDKRCGFIMHDVIAQVGLLRCGPVQG